MKIIRKRLLSVLCCRLAVFANQYNWIFKSEKYILFWMCRYLGIPIKNVLNLHYTISKLSPENIRRLIRLGEILSKYPQMFNRWWGCFFQVPIHRLETIFEKDIQWGCP